MRHLRTLAVALLAALALANPFPARAAHPNPFAALRFRSIGPAVSGGRLGAVAGSDRDPSLYYVGAADGGVWKSTDGGNTFAPVFDGQDVQSIGAIAIDPVRTQTVWVGTGESNPRNDVTQGDGIYKTEDGGKTWHHVLALRNSLVSRIVVDPRDTAHVAVAVLGDPFADSTDRGVYVTTDGGATWKKTLYLGPSSGASDLAADPADPQTLYAGMWQFRRTGWSLQSGGPEDGLFRSTDGGATWTKLTGHGLPAGETGRIGIAISPSNPERIYALIQSKHGLLWRSDDGGARWTMTTNDPLIDERPFYFSTIFVDPTNPNRLWAENVHMTVSTDGGRHFTITGRGTHGDHHEMWISRDGRRIIEGDDGGVAFSFDGGATFAWRKVLPISQLYHIGYSRELPYRICAALQDNGLWCGPSDPRNPRGISASQWITTGGGDGTWALPDPGNPHLIWQAAGGQNFAGEVSVHDLATDETFEVGPYLRDQNVVNPKDMRYRFNWETPIAFDPFDPNRVYTAGNVLFVTHDRGVHWRAISPDLTRNDRAHQVVTGGITLDGTGAETSDTILSIAPSHAARGEIWIGTDDGRVQLTRDGGAHWRDVTPSGIAPFGRFASISPAANDPATAYAVYDLHMTGDRSPYVFATHDYGAHWKAIDAGLPRDDEARCILSDPRAPHVLFLGLERSLMASWDDGATWHAIGNDIPAVSVRDLQIQPDRNDLLVATHGRGAYVLDDITPLEAYPAAKRAGVMLFAPRTAYAWNEHSYWGTRIDGAGPPYGALITYYQSAPAKHAPSIEILDEHGMVVRHIDDLPNLAGYNRTAWDLTGDDVHPWTFAPKWNRGTYDPGAPVLPGTYTVRLKLDGRTLTQTVAVRQDPRTHYTMVQLAAHRNAIVGLLADFSRIDDALDIASLIERNAPLRARAVEAEQPDLAQKLDALRERARAVIAEFSSNPQNDQDDDFLVDRLRERMQTQIDTFYDSTAPPTAEQVRENAVLHQLTGRALAAYQGLLAETAGLDDRLRAAGLPSLRSTTTTKR